MRQSLRTIRGWIGKTLWLFLFALLMVSSTFQPRDPAARVRRYTRSREFEFVSWTLDALRYKLEQTSIRTASYIQVEEAQALVLRYFDLVNQARQLEARLIDLYADPELDDPNAAATSIIVERNAVWDQQSQLQPIIEAILEEQVGFVLAEIGLHFGGAPFPPVAFHFTRPPMALIVSPRDVIRQDANISIEADIALEDQISLEAQVETDLDISALVVGVGGIGVYPTMIQETSSVSWLIETIVHEWVHNYLTLRPLGFNYYTSEALRTMNETAANLLGKEIGRLVLERYYPAFVPLPPTEAPESPLDPSPPPVFDFRAEMRTTRVRVDELLSEDQVEQAEAYMEARREVFWENGYRIRRINQAYFAFFGAYADQPGGAAGEDPVGAAVRALWDMLDSPVKFLRTMAWMNDFGDLEAALKTFSVVE